MSRSVRRCGRYGAAEKGAEIRGRWGCAAAAKAGALRRTGAKVGGLRRGLSAFRQSAENRGNCAADVSAVRGLGTVDAVGGQSARSTRQERPAGKLLFALLLPEASGGGIPGHLWPWGHDAAAFIFPRRRHLRQNLGVGEGAFCTTWEVCGKSGNSAHPKRRASEGVAAAQGRGVRRGGRAGACVPGAKNRSPAGERCRAGPGGCRTRLSAGVRQRASRFPRRTSCRRAFP